MIDEMTRSFAEMKFNLSIHIEDLSIAIFLNFSFELGKLTLRTRVSTICSMKSFFERKFSVFGMKSKLALGYCIDLIELISI